MPPKPKVTRGDIVSAAFALVREHTSLPCDAEGEGFYTAEIKREKIL